MKCEIRPFDEETLSDAKKVVSEMYTEKTCALLDKMLANPLRKELTLSSVGDVVYQDDNPVAFQGAIPRRLYIGQKPITSIVGSTLCSRPDTSPVLLMKLMRKTIAPRSNSEIFFANTANNASYKMNRLLGVNGACPSTYYSWRFAVLKWHSFVAYLIRRKIFKRPIHWQEVAYDKYASFEMHRSSIWFQREMAFDGETYDRFFSEYLIHNKGVVSSRYSYELEYMFGNRLRSGACVLISAREGDKIIGYIVIESENKSWTRWQIIDLIALENDGKILKMLINAAKSFLRRTPAVLLVSIGFSPHFHNVFSSTLPFSRKLYGNFFLYKVYDKSDFTDKLIESADSWFFGPYDGDMCL